MMAMRCPFDRIPVLRQAPMARVETGSHVTLHYRLAVVTDGEEREVVSTLTSRPATLQIGSGQLAPAIEARLVGLDEGAQAALRGGGQDVGVGKAGVVGHGAAPGGNRVNGEVS